MGRDPLLQLSVGIAVGAPVQIVLAQEGHDEPDTHTEQDSQGGDTHAGDSHAADTHGDDTHAAHSGDHETVGALPSVKQGMVTGITAVVVFCLVLGVLWLKVWPTIASGLDEREKKIRDEIESAEDARKQAKDALDSYEKSLGEARAEAQQMLEQAKSDQQKLTAELKAKAEADLGAMKEKAQREIESAKRAAVSEIYNEAATLATTVAGKILAREVSSDDQQRLVDEAVAELSGAGQ
jgi:F-type H+-transporting ATPase subunit b